MERKNIVRLYISSAGMGVFGAAGLYALFVLFTHAAFHEASKHPISHPIAIAVGALAFFACLGAICLYVYGLRNLKCNRKAMHVAITVVVIIAAFIVGVMAVGAVDQLSEPIKAIFNL